MAVKEFECFKKVYFFLTKWINFKNPKVVEWESLIKEHCAKIVIENGQSFCFMKVLVKNNLAIIY